MKIVQVVPRALEEYREILGPEMMAQITSLARDLRGLRVAHVNATAYGGGVAEILHSLIPLYHDLGIEATWYILDGHDAFYNVTKNMHNALQGAHREFSEDEFRTYLDCNEQNALALLNDGPFDLIIAHDPQPAALRRFARQAASRWIWRCHIDTSTPNADAWRFINSMVQDYEAAVFSLPDFVGPGMEPHRLSIIPPAIDPLSAKNRPLPVARMREVVASHGIDLERPFISQVSRFDPWKDPLGVIACFRRLKESHPDLQLAMLGNFADDDPEGLVLYQEVLKAAEGVPDIHIITGLTDLVNPFQAMSAVVLQKSLREGFGLTVSEALWKGTPVVGGNAGGIRLQILDGVGGYLVNSVDECVRHTAHLLDHEEERLALGRAGREHVRNSFLLPRLLRDELALVQEVLSGDGAAEPARGRKEAVRLEEYREGRRR